MSTINNNILKNFEQLITSLFKSTNTQYIKQLQPKITAIKTLKPKYKTINNEKLKTQTTKFHKQLTTNKTLNNLLIKTFTINHKTKYHFLNMHHYDIQLINNIILHNKNITKIITKKKKTLITTLPTYLNSLTKNNIHIITINNYLTHHNIK